METVVRFVRQETSNGDLLEKTFREAQQMDSNCVWMSEEECLSFKERDRKAVFIFDKFEGAAFQHLSESGNRIYGASVILNCMKNNGEAYIALLLGPEVAEEGSQDGEVLNMEKLPKLEHPVHNLSMMGFIICCTNVERSIRDKTQQLIRWMCGEISKEFHDKVTHLVAGEIGSKKYVVAATLEKPIMQPEWVFRVWEDSQTMYVAANDEPYKSEYRCKVFQGCVITVSGLESDERVEVRDIIEQEGGRYTGEMKLNECTHLIVNEPKGQKYEFAKKWRLPIVKPLWLFDSVDKGYCIDITNKYKVTSESHDQKTTSTPTGAAPPSRRSYAPNVSCVSVDHVNETAMDQTRQQNDITMNQSVQQGPDTAELDELDLKEIKTDMFLDGCKIFLSGFTGQRLEKLRRLINKGGGTRFSQINETISHVVLGNRVEEHVRLLQEGQFRLSVVSSAWIVACAKTGTQAPEDLYTCLELPDVEPMTPVSKPRKSSVAAPSVSEPARQAPVDPDRTIGQEDMQDLLSQYLPQNADMTDESALMRAVTAAEQVAPQNEDEDMTQDPTQETQEGGIFAGKKLALVGLMNEEEQQLSAQITEADGIVVGVKSRAVPDFAVVPFNGCPVPMTVTEIVTNAYIRMCLEYGELLPIEENPMFTPITFRAESDPLEGCVLSVSGYSGVERDVLMHIAEQMGAKCQEYFVKKARKNLLTSTHLVVNTPSGSKFEAANKWGLPAVDRGWLYECARSGNRVPEEPYLINRPQDETGNDTTVKEEPALQTPTTSAMRPPTTPAPQTPKTPAPQTPTTSTTKEPKMVHIPMENGNGASSLSPKENHVPDKKEVNKLPHQRVKQLITQTKQESPRQKKDCAGVDSPSQFLKPGVVYHANFDLTDCMSALETPEVVRKKRERKTSLPLGELLVKNLDVALKKSSVRQKMPGTPAPARRETINQSIFKEGPTGPLKGVVVAVSKKLSGQQSDINNTVAELGADYRWTYDQSCTHFVFQGRRNDTSKEFRTAREHGKIIVSPHWITMCKEQNAHVDEKLFPHDFNPNLSLSVTSTKTETPKRLSTRRSARSRVRTEEAASPVLRATKRTRSKATEEIDLTVDEGPAKKSPKKSPGNKKASKQSDNGEDDVFSTHDKTCSNDEIAAACQDVEQEPPATQPANTLAREAFVDDLTSLMAATKTYSKGKRKSNRRTDSLSGEVEEEPDVKQISLSRSSNKSEESDNTPKGSGRRATRNSRSSRAGKKSDACTEPSQMVEVTWDDPQTRQQQEKLAAELAKNSESLSPRPVNFMSDEDRDEEETTDEEIVFAPPQKEKSRPREEERIQTPDPPSLAFPTVMVPPPEKTNLMEDEGPAEVDMDETVDEEKTPPIFLLSGMSTQERTDYGALVEQLGGRMSDASHYDINCTHLVVGLPTRNEKYLACVAAGKWVLHKSYFEACRQQNRFVEEDEHEWGSEATQAILKGQPSIIGKLARAAHRWRRQVIEGNGAFSNWTCILFCDNKKEDGLMRLLLAGGATVRATRPPFTNLEDLNFAFMDLGKVKQKVDVNEFLKAGVHCVKPEYMSSYLMEDPIPEPRKFSIPEVTGASSDSRKRKPSGCETPNSKRSRMQ